MASILPMDKLKNGAAVAMTATSWFFGTVKEKTVAGVQTVANAEITKAGVETVLLHISSCI